MIRDDRGWNILEPIKRCSCFALILARQKVGLSYFEVNCSDECFDRCMPSG